MPWPGGAYLGSVPVTSGIQIPPGALADFMLRLVSLEAWPQACYRLCGLRIEGGRQVGAVKGLDSTATSCLSWVGPLSISFTVN